MHRRLAIRTASLVPERELEVYFDAPAISAASLTPKCEQEAVFFAISTRLPYQPPN